MVSVQEIVVILVFRALDSSINSLNKLLFFMKLNFWVPNESHKCVLLKCSSCPHAVNLAMLNVRYKFIETMLGRSLAAEAVTEEGPSVCFVAFPNAKSDEESLLELYKLYPMAVISDKLQLHYEEEVYS